MSDTRHKNVNWMLPVNNQTYASASLAVLMDIRDELQTLNGWFRCRNFQEIPGILRTIRGNTSRIKKEKP